MSLPIHITMRLYPYIINTFHYPDISQCETIQVYYNMLLPWQISVCH